MRIYARYTIVLTALLFTAFQVFQPARLLTPSSATSDGRFAWVDPITINLSSNFLRGDITFNELVNTNNSNFKYTYSPRNGQNITHTSGCVPFTSAEIITRQDKTVQRIHGQAYFYQNTVSASNEDPDTVNFCGQDILDQIFEGYTKSDSPSSENNFTKPIIIGSPELGIPTTNSSANLTVKVNIKSVRLENELVTDTVTLKQAGIVQDTLVGTTVGDADFITFGVGEINPGTYEACSRVLSICEAIVLNPGQSKTVTLASASNDSEIYVYVDIDFERSPPSENTVPGTTVDTVRCVDAHNLTIRNLSTAYTASTPSSRGSWTTNMVLYRYENCTQAQLSDGIQKPAAFQFLEPGTYEICSDILGKDECEIVNKASYEDNPTVILTGKGDVSLILDDDNSSSSNSCQSNIRTLGWILCPLGDLMVDAIKDIAQGPIQDLLVVDLGDNDPLQETWSAFVGIANVLFILGFLIIIVFQTLRG